MKIYHNPRCSKSRNALQILEEKGADVEVVKYLDDTPSKTELKALLGKLGMKAEEIVRKGEKDYKENFKGKSLSDDEWIDAFIQYPKLIERPIFVNGDKAVVGRPPENVLELL
ncbi:arsenate reductase (glutaredoxin) [Brumimicrobium aurantiacum]|uniref:Arsenate reductase (Glutaredoxin) n=1 Tax=Brumimicrobium aurantiacum TaxID=1737063 RepID=A0A3E1EVM4_9FLAO|nr:arsenate reductase (glutaredoxin) [Brumimicrobium aurantiacum]RFC53600.1 arsenate reductase (glutaredoxin) [Brumimicrobium aurantiacum]